MGLDTLGVLNIYIYIYIASYGESSFCFLSGVTMSILILKANFLARQQCVSANSFKMPQVIGV